MINIRIDIDKELTKLLKRHPKYKVEYEYNIHAQNLFYLVLRKLTPLFFSLAIAEEAIKIANETFFKEGIIK